jgi:hypothetical protein
MRYAAVVREWGILLFIRPSAIGWSSTFFSLKSLARSFFEEYRGFGAMNAREARRRWIREGRNRIDRDAWTKIFASSDPQQFMTARERKKFEALPDTFTVYRGYVNFPNDVFDNADGLSWTLDRNVAEFFASEMMPDVVSNVVERIVEKSDVFAYVEKNGNNEKEIIILPE